MRLASSLILVCVACAAPPKQTLPPAPTTVHANVQTFVAREPVARDADTLYDEYIASTSGRTHAVVPLTGQLTCYGGPALDGNLPAEVYVRRAVNRDAIVEDVVEIYPDDLVPRRRIVTMRRGPGMSPMKDGANHRCGHALIEDDAADRSVQAFVASDGAIVLLAHQASADELRMVALSLDNDTPIDVDKLTTEAAWFKLQDQVSDLADSSILAIKGELPAIPPGRCETMFSHFPPVSASRSSRP